MKKPLLVGEANPYQDNREDAMYFALHPDPPQASGGRLCHLIMGLDERTYLRSFDRIDLCHPKWNIREAREHAQRLVAEREPMDVIVLCGSKVASAFGIPFHPFTIHGAKHDTLAGPRLVVLPHPSALCRIWYEPNAVERARSVLRAVGVLT